MSLGADIKYQMTALFSSAYDEKSAKQVEQQAMAAARRAAEASEKEFEAAFRGFGDIINGALKQMKIQPIDIDELIKLPKSAAFSKLGTEFGAKFAKGFKGAVSSGGIDSTVMDQIKQLEQQRSKLSQRHKTLPKEISQYQDLMDISGAFEDEFHAFSKEEVAKMGASVDEVSQSMLEGLDESLGHLSKLERGTKEFEQALVETYRKANDVFRMSRTLSKHPDWIADKSILEDYDFDSLQEIYNSDVENEFSLMHYDRDFSDFIKRQQKLLDAIPAKIKEIDQQLTTLRHDNPDIIDVEQTRSGLKALQEVEEAYKRILNAKGKVGKQGKNINDALEFDPSKSDKGIQSLYKQYMELPEGSPWEVEYAALLRYVKLYESYLNSENETHRNKVTKPHNEYTKLYKQLKPLEADAETSLRNVLNMANNLPLIDVDKTETTDVDDTAKQTQEAHQLAEAEAKARAETEARAQAGREAAEATEKEKLAKEAIAKADAQKDAGVESANLKEVKQDAVEAEKAVENLNNALKETKDAKQAANTSSDDDASSAELKAAQEEIERLKKEASDEEGRLNRERAENIERLDNARVEAEAAEKRAREAEEELARIKAESDGKKLVDKDAPDDDSEIRRLRAELENEQQERMFAENALYSEAERIFEMQRRAEDAEEEAERLRKQLADVDTTPNKIRKQAVGGDVDLETTQLKGVQEAVEAVTTAVNQKNKAFHNEGEVVGQVVGKEISTLSHLETQVKGVNEQLEKLFGTLKNVRTSAQADIKVKVEDVDTKKQPSPKSKEKDSSEETPKRSKADMNALEKDYEKLGRLMARLDDDGFLVKSAEIENLEAEIKRKQESLGLTEKEISALKEKEMIAQRAEENIIQAEKAQAAKDKKAADKAKFDSDVEKLAKQYEKLGKLQAEADANVPGKKAEVEQLERVIQQETERLGLNKEQNAEILKSIQLRQQEARASKTALLADKQRVKDENAEWKAQVKAARGNAGVNVANSAVTAGNRIVTDVIGDTSITKDIEAKARELQEATRELANMKDEVSRAIAEGAEADSDGLARQTKRVKELTEEMNELMAVHRKYADAEDIGDDIGSFKDLDDDEYRKQLTAIAEASVNGKLRSVEFNNETKELIGTVKTGANEFTTYSFAIDEVSGKVKKLNQGTKQTESFFEGMARKTKELAQYALSSISIYDVYNQVRQGVIYVKELDTAMTELRKVTDESEESYARFLDTSSDRAGKIGTTVTNLVNSTADWARIGYSMEEAAKLAESTSVLLNVSEFGNIDEATSALTSTMQAFSYEADRSMHVVDIMNEIGNNYAISSDGIATALQDSASALMTANNSYEEAVAMVAAANKVVQDPSKVGGGLRTIALRLRGTKVEGEEDNDTVVTSKSKLQAQIKGLSGVDILTDTGAYKSTYQILLEISRVWKDMNDMDQAALLEIIAGKNRSNIAASILGNQKDLEAAFASAQEAEGSALRENEKYLDSIQGKMDQFMNSLQIMWNSLIGSDIIKNVVDFGRVIIDIIGDLGLFGTALAALVVIKVGPWLVKFIADTNTLGEAFTKLVSVNGKSLAKYFAEQMAGLNGVTGRWTKLGITLKSLGKTMGQFFQTTAGKLTIMVAAITAVIAISKSLIETTKDKEEKFQELSNTLDETKGKLSDLSSQLAETSARMDELLSKDTLTFTEQEELERLRAQSAELQRQIDLYETLKTHQQKAVNNQAIENADDYMNANFATGKGKGEYQEKGATVGSITGGAVGVKLGGLAGAAIGTAAATALGGKLGAIAGSVVPVVGNIIGALLGAGLGALIGTAIGGGVADAQEQVGESMDAMYQRRIKLQEDFNKAQAEYNDNPDSEKASEAYTKAEEALASYDSKMSDHLNKMNSYYSSIDLGVYDPVTDAEKIRQLRKEMDEFYDTQDKWAILSGGTNAKTNAINRIFGENATDELKDVKKAMEEAAAAGEEISLEDAFGPDRQADFDAFIARLHEMGIYAYEVEEAFKRMATETEGVMSTDLYDTSKSVGGVKSGVEGITEALEKARKEGYLTAGELDGIAETLGGAEALGDVWTKFAEIMSTNTSTLKEQREAAEALVETYLDNQLMQGGPLSSEEQHVMITQLQDMGVWNAREYVQDKNLENMYKEIQKSADYDWDAVQKKWTEIQNNWENGSQETIAKLQAAGINEKKAWEKLTQEQKEIIAEASGEFKQVSVHDAWNISKKYGSEPEEGIRYVVALMNERNKVAREYQDIIKDETKINNKSMEINRVDDLLSAYEKLKDYGEREYFNAAAQDMNADAAWKIMYATDSSKYYDEDLKKQWTQDYDSFKSLYDNLQLKLPDVDLSSLEKVEEYKAKLEKDKIALQAEYDKTGSKELKAELKAQMDAIDAQIEALTPDVNIEFSYDLNKVKSDIEATKTAISESLSGTGMTEDSIENIRAIYGEYRDYNEAELFEKTANGIQVNVKALKDLQTQQEKAYKSELSSTLAKEQKEYDRLTEAIENSTSAQEMSNLMAERNTVEDNIESLAMLQAQYEGLTSAYQKWVDAQAGPKYGDQAENAKSMFEQLKQLRQNEDYGEDAYRAGLQYYTNEDLSSKAPADLTGYFSHAEKINKRYFSENADGAYNFAEDMAKAGAAYGNAVDGYTIDMKKFEEAAAQQTKELGRTVTAKELLANELKVSESLIDTMINEMRSKGAIIDGDNLFTNLDDFHGDIESVRDAIKKITGEKINLEFTADNVDEIDSEIDKIKGVLDQLEADAKAQGIPLGKIEGAQEAQTMLNYLIALKYELEIPSVLTVSTAGFTEAQTTALTAIENIRAAYRDYQIKLALQGPESKEVSDAQTKVEAAVSALSSTTDIVAELKLDEGASATDIAAAVAAISVPDIPATIKAITTDVDDYVPGDKSAKVTYGVDKKKVDAYKPKNKTASVIFKPNTTQIDNYQLPRKTQWVDLKYRPFGDSEARGTAFASGTAFARGNWGASKSGTALGGELGPEIVVRDGRWFTIGDNGAEFFQYKKDDIIFNAAQSQQILEKGKITTGNRRGTALAEGTAFVTGTLSSRNKPNTSSSSSSSSSNKSSNKSSSNQQKSDNDKTELERITEWFGHQMNDFDHRIATNEKNINIIEAKDWIASADFYRDMIADENERIYQNNLQRQQLIELFDKTEPETEEWYKIRDAINAVDEAIQDSTLSMIDYRSAIVDLYATAFEKISTAFDSNVQLKDDQLAYLQGYAELLELKGEVPNVGLYEAQIDTVQKRKAINQEKWMASETALMDLKAERDKYVKWSPEWYKANEAVIEQEAAQRQILLNIQTDDKDIETIKNELETAFVSAWDKVTEAFENKDAYFENQQSYIESYIDRLETMNINVPDQAYDKLIEVQKKRNNNYDQELAWAYKELEDLKSNVDSPEYIAKLKEISDLEGKKYEGETKILEYGQKIIDNQFDRFNQVVDRINHTVDKLQNISDLISDEDVATKDGEWTDEGLTRLGLAYQQMEYNKQIAEEYADKIEELESLYKSGKISEKKYTEQLQELEDGQWDAINSYEDTKDSIIELNEARIDMIEDGLNKEIEAYQELIELRKEELDAERDLYDFKKGVEDQAKNISSLERRIVSMSGSTDASTIAERTKLEAELRNAKDELDGSYRDHAYDSISKALDDELEAYEKNHNDYIERLRESIKNTDTLIEQTYKDVLANSEIVLETINTMSETYGFEIDSHLTYPWENATRKTIDFDSAVSNHISTIATTVKTSVSSLTEDLEAPWKGASKKAITFNGDALSAIDEALTQAKKQQAEMKSSLSEPWTGAQDVVTEWGKRVNDELWNAIDRSKKAAAEISKNLNAGQGTSTSGGNSTNSSSGSNEEKYGATVNGVQSASPYSGKWNNNVGNLQVVLVEAFGYPVGKKNGKYSYVPDGLWGSTTAESVKKMQKTIGANQTGKYDSQTYNKLSAWLTNKYNNDSNTQKWQRALTYMPKAFAKGTMGTNKDQWALDSEPWLGDEIVLVPGQNGNLSYMRKGTAIMPADISANLVEWGKLNPNMMNFGDMSGGIQMMSNYVNKPEIKIDVENFLKVDRVDQDSLPQLEKLMDKKIDTFARQLNAGLRKFK